MKLHRIIRIAALCLSLTAVAAPVATARPDLEPPTAVHQSLSGFYRPSIPNVAARHDGSSKYVDLRSPDARDAARGVDAHRALPASVAAKPDDGTNWGRVGIIGGVVLAAIAITGLGFVVFVRRTPLPSS